MSEATVGRTARRGGTIGAALSGSGTTWLLVPPLLFLGVLLVVPIGFLIWETFIRGGFMDAVENEAFRNSIPRTFLMALIVSVFALVCGTIYALALVIAPTWMKVVLFFALFTIFWTSLLVRTYGWILLILPQGALYWALHGLGLRDAPLDIYQKTPAPYPAMVHVMLPYVVLPVYAAARSLDPMHIRAARVLGAKPFLILWKVVLPQLRSGMVSGAILVFVMSLGFYVTPQLLGAARSPMVASLIGTYFNTPNRAGTAAAMSLLLLLVVVVVYLVADRVFKVSEQWGRA